MEAQATAQPESILDMPLADGQLDLIPEVTRIMREAGLGHEVTAAFESNDLIAEGRGKCLDAQRFYLNRFWHQQLGGHQNRTGDNTIDYRFCLLDKGTGESWIKHFSEMIIPFAIEKRLPAALA